MEEKLEEALRLPLAGKLQRNLLLRFYRKFTVSDFVRCVDYLIERDFSWVSESDKTAAREISKLAINTMRGNLYHCPEHSFHVAFVALILSQELRCSSLSPRLKFLLFLGALGHDVGHDGRMDSSGNFAMEIESANHVAQILYERGFSDEEVSLVRNLILATCAPHRKLIMRLVDAVEMGCLHLAASHMDIPEELGDLRHDEALIRMCGILSDADLFFSVALGMDTSLEQSERVFAEADAWSGQPSSLSMGARRQAFFKHVVTNNFASPSGSEFSPSLEQLWDDAFGEKLSLRAASFSRRTRHLKQKERDLLRNAIFSWAGGFSGYRECSLHVVDGHMLLKRDLEAFALTRSGLILEGCLASGRFQGKSYLGTVGA
jgi:hypothetical protein